ncbi:MAG: PfkB family carbohydrate kinase [Ancrocorticia sp.]|uniref:PfkB family carbohydrate kinase n=1 Tax=Ancrocorticia sp. TaxID=2593684 RepID=UPI003F8E5099
MRTVFCGLTTIDLIQLIEAVPAPGTKAVSDSALLDVGGPAANAARTAGALGAYPTLISPIGTGVFAQLAHTWLEGAGVQLIDVAAEGDPAISAVAIDAQGDRTVISTNNTARSHSFPEPDVLDGATALMVDGHLLDVQIALARTAESAGIPVILDGGSYKPGLDSLLPHVTHAVVSADFELPGVSRDQTLETLRGYGIGFVARTHGGGNIEAIVENKAYSLPITQPGTIADTLGAGDVLHGAFTAALGAGQDGLSSLAAAAQLATLSVRSAGAMGWVEKL